MMIFDASTLILLAKVELLDLFLDGMSVKGAIHTEVARECCRGKKTLDSLLIQRVIDEARITVFEVKDRKLVMKLEFDFGLGRGESEAIALAVTRKARLLGIDDKNGINACKFLGVPFTTAINILVGCRESELLSHPEACLRVELLSKYGRYGKTILDDVKARLEAQK
jgi:predicted nucleic acid-binding protein